MYFTLLKKDPATYYFCKGWIEYGGDSYRCSLKFLEKMVSGDVNEKNLLLFKPGQKITREHFFKWSAT